MHDCSVVEWLLLKLRHNSKAVSIWNISRKYTSNQPKPVYILVKKSYRKENSHPPFLWMAGQLRSLAVFSGKKKISLYTVQLQLCTQASWNANKFEFNAWKFRQHTMLCHWMVHELPCAAGLTQHTNWICCYNESISPC